MAERILPSSELLRQLLRYEPETGKLYWKMRPREMFVRDMSWRTWNTKNAGKEAFTAISAQGYRAGAVNGRMFAAHRVIFAMHYGFWPTECVDHIDRDKSNNRIANLRAASYSENSRNRGKQANNTSGRKGVFWDKKLRRWLASIKHHQKQRNLGYYDDKESAYLAYKSAAEKLHGEFVFYE